jgi:hypothetical protein
MTIRVNRRAPPAPIATASAVPTRNLRRVARSVAAAQGVGIMAAQERSVDEQRIKDALQSIAEYQEQIASIAALMAVQEEEIELLMKKHKIPSFTDGRLLALYEQQYTNEKKDVDPKKLFDKKGFKREDFFACVKVQLGELKKYLAENEIKSIATVTPPQKAGMKLTIKPVKPVVTTKPEHKPKKPRGRA